MQPNGYSLKDPKIAENVFPSLDKMVFLVEAELPYKKMAEDYASNYNPGIAWESYLNELNIGDIFNADQMRYYTAETGLSIVMPVINKNFSNVNIKAISLLSELRKLYLGNKQRHHSRRTAEEIPCRFFVASIDSPEDRLYRYIEEELKKSEKRYLLRDLAHNGKTLLMMFHPLS